MPALRIAPTLARQLAREAACNPTSCGFLLGDPSEAHADSFVPIGGAFGRVAPSVRNPDLRRARGVSQQRGHHVLAFPHVCQGAAAEPTEGDVGALACSPLPWLFVRARSRHAAELALYTAGAEPRRVPHLVIRAGASIAETTFAALATHPLRAGVTPKEHVAGLLDLVGYTPDPKRPVLVPHHHALERAHRVLRRLDDLGVSVDLRLAPHGSLGRVAARATPRADNNDVLVSARLAVATDIVQASFAAGMIPTDLGAEQADALAGQLADAVASTRGGRQWRGLALELALAPSFVDPPSLGADFRIRLPLLLRGELVDGTSTTPVDVALDLEIALQLGANTGQSGVTVRAQPGNATQSVIVIDDTQPLHPVTDEERQALAEATQLIHFALATDVADSIAFPLLTDIVIPSTENEVEIHDTSATVVPAAGGAEILVGVALGPTGVPDEEQREAASALVGLLRPSDVPTRRSAARMDVFGVQQIVDGLIRGHALDRDGIRIDRASVSMDTNAGVNAELLIDMHGRAIDSCDILFGALGSVNVDFDVRVRAELQFNGDELGIRIWAEDPDVSNWDVFLCIAGNLLIGILITELLPLVAIQLGILIYDAVTSGGPVDPTFLRIALPLQAGHIRDTEVAAEVPVFATSHDDRSFTLFGDVRLVDDALGRYFYFRVVGGEEGDVIVVKDRDNPPPVGDQPPVVGQPERGRVGQTFEASPDFIDDVLAQKEANIGGITQIRIARPDMETQDGTIRARVILSEIDAEAEFSVMRDLPLVEVRPDLFFQLRRGSRVVADSRAFPGRLPIAVNFAGRGMGTPDEPIVLTVAPALDPGGGVLDGRG